MKDILAVILATLILLLPGCGGVRYSPPAGNPPPETPSTSPSAPSPALAKALNVRIDYIGVKNAYDYDDPWDSRSEVQLVVVATDGKTATPEDEVFIPNDKAGYKMVSFETKEINRRVFHTSSAGDYLRVSIAAWDVDSKTETLDALSVLEAFGIAGAAELRTFYDMLPQEDDRIGDYSKTWYRDESWGVGQHEEVCDDNLLLGFSVWSDEEPPPLPEPVLLPDVKIQNVAMPSQVKQSNSGWFYWITYANTLTLVNNEPIDVEVDWKAYSKATKENLITTPRLCLQTENLILAAPISMKMMSVL